MAVELSLTPSSQGRKQHHILDGHGVVISAIEGEVRHEKELS